MPRVPGSCRSRSGTCSYHRSVLPTIPGDRITLRPWRPGDAADLYRAMQDPETVRWMAIELPYTIEDAEGFIAGTESAWTEKRAAHLVIADGDDHLIGYLGVLSVEEEMRVVEIGYWVSAAHRGRGFATDALRTAVAWAESELRPERIELGMLAGNERSRRVAEKAGFVFDRSEPSGKLLDGKSVAEWIFSLERGRP
ncbi:MAG: N-acetyltransferase [Actinobacteria bacterium]|nr:MAG: N-acetyltransferase [Actinomycetota bacterium]